MYMFFSARFMSFRYIVVVVDIFAKSCPPLLHLFCTFCISFSASLLFYTYFLHFFYTFSALFSHLSRIFPATISHFFRTSPHFFLPFSQLSSFLPHHFYTSFVSLMFLFYTSSHHFRTSSVILLHLFCTFLFYFRTTSVLLPHFFRTFSQRFGTSSASLPHLFRISSAYTIYLHIYLSTLSTYLRYLSTCRCSESLEESLVNDLVGNKMASMIYKHGIFLINVVKFFHIVNSIKR